MSFQITHQKEQIHLNLEGFTYARVMGLRGELVVLDVEMSEGRFASLSLAAQAERGDENPNFAHCVFGCGQ